MKVSIENVESILLEKKIEPIKVKDIIKDLEQVVEEEKEERKANSGPKSKWEHIIILYDKEGFLKGKELVGWVVQQSEGEDSGLVLSKLTDAARNQNEAAKRKKSFLTNMVDLFEGLKSKWLKEKKLKIKTKDLTRVIITDGSLR